MVGRHLPPDYGAGDERTLGGYMAVHARPAAFEGSDGLSYSVDVAVDETGEPNPAEPNTVFPAATPDVEAVFPARAPDVGDAAGTAEAAESATAEEAGSDEAGPEEAGPEEAIPEEAIARFATSDAADAVGREEAVAAQVADATQSDIPSDAVAAAPPADVESRAGSRLLGAAQLRLVEHGLAAHRRKAPDESLRLHGEVHRLHGAPWASPSPRSAATRAPLAPTSLLPSAGAVGLAFAEGGVADVEHLEGQGVERAA